MATVLGRSPKGEGGPWLTLTTGTDQVRPGCSGHINRSRVNQDLFYISPSLSLEDAEQRISLILSKVYKERSFHRELVSPDFLVPVTSSLSATEAPLSVSVVWPINNIDPWKLQPAVLAAGMQHPLQWARCLDLCSIHCTRKRVHPGATSTRTRHKLLTRIHRYLLAIATASRIRLSNVFETTQLITQHWTY